MIRNIFRRKPKVEPVATGDVAAAHALLNRCIVHETPLSDWVVTPYRDALLFEGRGRYLVLGVTIVQIHPKDEDIESYYGVIADAEALSADWDAKESR